MNATNGQTRTADRQWDRARKYIAGGQRAAACATLETLLKHTPGHVHARLLLASVYLAQQHLRQACEQLRMAAQGLPDNPEDIATTAYYLHKVGESAALRDCLTHPAIARIQSVPDLMRFANLHQLLGQHSQALALMERAKSAGIDAPEFRYYYSLQLQFNGRLEEAEAELAAALGDGTLGGRGAISLAHMHRQTPDANHLDYIAAKLQAVEPGSPDQASFEFARFKELDDLDRRDAAWTALEHGNAIMYARMHHDMERERRHFAAIKRICSAAFVSTPAPSHQGPAPIFIVGMPRSGTTLLERILSNHSQVSSSEEIRDFVWQMQWAADFHTKAFVDDGLLERLPGLDYAGLGQRYLEQTQWRANGAPFFIDKFHRNFMLAGFIHRALPRARILHMVRDPMGVCFSNWKAMFGNGYSYSYQLGALADHYRQYRELMAHWHEVMPGVVLDVSYEEIVRDPESVTARVLAFCGLPSEPGCSDITTNRAPVSTLSTAQVRQPIHRDAIASWRRYDEQLRPLSTMLASLADASS